MSTVSQQAFLTTRRSVWHHPAYFIRKGLHECISARRHSIRGKVLDFGCGSKPYESLFGHVESYTGVDIEVSGHSHANSKVDVFYDGKTLPFADESFDSLVSFEVLEHVFNPDEVLAEMRRVLKPGGTMLLTLPFGWGEHEQPYDYARYTSFGITALLNRTGFAVTEVAKSNTGIRAIGQLAAAYLHEQRPRSRALAAVYRISLVMPLNILVATLSYLLPDDQTFYSSLVVTAQRSGDPLDARG